MNFECNIFSNVWDQDCSNVVKITSVLKGIQSGRWKDRILEVRANTGNKEKLKNLKFALPAVTWSGVFEERLDSACVVYNKLMVIDIDNISGRRLKRLKEELKNNPWVYAYFDGPTKGIKILVFITSEIEWHNTHAFSQLSDLFSELYGIDIDPSGKNISRLCFVSYDPSLYINPEPMALKIEEQVDSLEGFRSLKKAKEFTGGVQINDASDIFEVAVKMVKKSKTGSYHKGNRNNFVFSLSCLLCEFGIDPETALSLIYSRYESLGPKELINTVESAYRRNKSKYGTKTLNGRGNTKQTNLL